MQVAPLARNLIPAGIRLRAPFGLWRVSFAGLAGAHRSRFALLGFVGARLAPRCLAFGLGLAAVLQRLAGLGLAAVSLRLVGLDLAGWCGCCSVGLVTGFLGLGGSLGLVGLAEVVLGLVASALGILVGLVHCFLVGAAVAQVLGLVQRFAEAFAAASVAASGQIAHLTHNEKREKNRGPPPARNNPEAQAPSTHEVLVSESCHISFSR